MKTSGFIFDIKKFAIHDGPGIRTTIFFKGCPLRCWWCHNPESLKLEPEEMYKKNKKDQFNLKKSQIKEIIGQKISIDELMHEINKDIIFSDQSAGGVTVSGGEPFMQFDFLYELLKECKKQQIHTTVDTSGVLCYGNEHQAGDR